MLWFVPFKGLIFIRCRVSDQRTEKIIRHRKSLSLSFEGSRPSDRKRTSKISHTVVKPSGNPIDVEHRSREISFISKPVGWIKRDSDRIIRDKSPFTGFIVPYLSNWGKPTGMQLYTWCTTPSRFFFSYFATCLSRARYEINKKFRKGHMRRQMRTLYAKVLAICLINSDNYLLNRFIALVSKPGATKILQSIIKRFVTKMSDDKWFVYRHISSQIKWLDLRGNYPRDKLMLDKSFILRGKQFLRNLEDLDRSLLDFVYKFSLNFCLQRTTSPSVR